MEPCKATPKQVRGDSVIGSVTGSFRLRRQDDVTP